MPWKRALKEAAEGKFDGIGASYYTEERAKEFAYTEPFSKTETVFFKLESNDIEYNHLSELSPYTIGVSRSYAYPENFIQASELQKEYTSTPELNVKKLLRGRVDLIIGAKKVILYLLQTEFENEQGRIDIVDQVVGAQNLFVAFSRNTSNYEQKVADFNLGLEEIIQDGTLDLILSDYGFL